MSKQVFSKVLISGVIRPFFILAWPSKIFVPIPQGHVSKRFPEEKKKNPGGMSQHRDLVKHRMPHIVSPQALYKFRFRNPHIL